jgi:hypothetical protein
MPARASVEAVRHLGRIVEGRRVDPPEAVGAAIVGHRLDPDAFGSCGSRKVHRPRGEPRSFEQPVEPGSPYGVVENRLAPYLQVDPEGPVAPAGLLLGGGERRNCIRGLTLNKRAVQLRRGDAGEAQRESVERHDLGAREAGSSLPFGFDEPDRDAFRHVVH